MSSPGENTKRHFQVLVHGMDLLLSLLSRRTLATDKGFKERVREDMLVRLLDAFVWRSHGMPQCDSLH